MGSLTNINTNLMAESLQKHQMTDSGKDTTLKNSTCDELSNLKINNFNKISQNNKKDNFNNLLNKIRGNNSKAVNRRDDNNTVDTRNSSDLDIGDDKFKEIEKELEENIDDLTLEELVQCLNILVDFLNKPLNNNLSQNDNLNYIDMDALNDLKISLMDVINSNNLTWDSLSQDDLSQKLENTFSDLLNFFDNTQNVDVDTDTLKFINKLVSQINENISNDIESNSTLTEVINAAENKINELLNNSSKNDNELSLQNNSLNNIYKVIAESSNNDLDNNSNSQNSFSDSSKDEKVLQSILNDNNTDNVVPVFTTTTTIVNNVTGTVVETQQIVNVKTMAADIVQNVKYMASNDMREMIVKVNPVNLGEITIKLIEEDGIMKLQMKAASKETYSLLVQQSSDIKNQLSDQNIKIQDVNISLYEEDTTFFKDGEFSKSFDEQKGNRESGKTNAAHDNLEDEEEQEIDDYNSSAVNMLV